MNTSHFDTFVPDLPGGLRGLPTFVTSDDIYQAFCLGNVPVLDLQIPDTRYVLLEKDWVLDTAITQFIRFKEAIHGLPIAEIYTVDTYDCNAFAIGFYMWLRDCHRLHWSRSFGNAAPGVGWGYTHNRDGMDVPKQHAINLIATNTQQGVRVCGIEPQTSGHHADYGLVERFSFSFMHY